MYVCICIYIYIYTCRHRPSYDYHLPRGLVRKPEPTDSNEMASACLFEDMLLPEYGYIVNSRISLS